MMKQASVRYANNLLITWAGTYDRDGVFILPLDEDERAAIAGQNFRRGVGLDG